jgi:flagellar biosynthesis/type III secretory pathway ATPase
MLDRAIALHPQMEGFLQQNISEKALYGDSLAQLTAIVGGGPAG